MPYPLHPTPYSRRDLLSGGLGAVALACMLNEDASAQDAQPRLHFPVKAKRVIQIFCMGGVSHIDTFDHKPELAANDGKPMTNKGTPDTFFDQPGNLMKSPLD